MLFTSCEIIKARKKIDLFDIIRFICFLWTNCLIASLDRKRLSLYFQLSKTILWKQLAQIANKTGIKRLIVSDTFAVLSCDYCALITSNVSANQVKSNMPSVN